GRSRIELPWPASSAITYTPRPATAGGGRGPTRQRWEGEGRARSPGAALSWTEGRRVKVPAVWLCGAAKKEVTGTPLTLPLLRNGPLPLPASRARGVWRCLAETWRANDV